MWFIARTVLQGGRASGGTIPSGRRTGEASKGPEVPRSDTAVTTGAPTVGFQPSAFAYPPGTYGGSVPPVGGPAVGPGVAPYAPSLPGYGGGVVYYSPFAMDPMANKLAIRHQVRDQTWCKLLLLIRLGR